MKKILCSIITVCFLIAILLVLVSCGVDDFTDDTDNSSSNSNNDTLDDSCSHTWVDATCTVAKYCSKCSEVIGEALGHDIVSGLCTRCYQSFSTWEKGTFTDEFNQPTNDHYIVTWATGTFSNSVASNRTLKAAVQITKTDIAIMLWEYGNSLVKGIFDYTPYTITILDTNKRKINVMGTLYDGGQRVYIDDNYIQTVLDLLQQNGTLSFYLVDNKYSISTYLFSIETSDFKTQYTELMAN